jgi:AcrR family transcriptional regulator
MTNRTTQILDAALGRFSLRPLHLTSTAEIAQQAGVSVGTLFRTFPTKEDLLDNVYAHAVSKLQAPLLAGPSAPPRRERLTQVLQRWWHLPALVALAQPQVFDFWRLYQSHARFALRPTLLLGPFTPVLDLLERALARHVGPAKNPPPPPVMVAALAGQWTAALELVLLDPMCQASAPLRRQVLERAYAGWWQGLGLSEFTEVESGSR